MICFFIEVRSLRVEGVAREERVADVDAGRAHRPLKRRELAVDLRLQLPSLRWSGRGEEAR